MKIFSILIFLVLTISSNPSHSFVNEKLEGKFSKCVGREIKNVAVADRRKTISLNFAVNTALSICREKVLEGTEIDDQTILELVEATKKAFLLTVFKKLQELDDPS